MKRLIILNNKTAKKSIAKGFGYCDSAISHALNFNRNSENDMKIRIFAMKSGGILLQEVKDWDYKLLK